MRTFSAQISTASTSFDRGRANAESKLSCPNRIFPHAPRRAALQSDHVLNPSVATPSRPPLRLAVVGAGYHSRTFHLPALAHFQRQHPGRIALSALVEPNVATAAAVAAEFGFAATHRSIDDLLVQDRPDACLAITPVALNAAIATRLAREGLPLLVEKPLGATIAEARRLVADLAALRARAMVSVNRRFDPLLRAALEWIGARPILQIRALMARHARTEPEFVEHTGLHVVDAVRFVGGEVAAAEMRRQRTEGSDWFQAGLTFASGATGLVDLMPAAGTKSEVLKLLGSGWRVEIRAAEHDRGGWRAWTDGRLVRDEIVPPGTPLFIANGTYAETEAFLHALETGAAFAPTPADILPSMELCHRLDRAPLTAAPLPL